MLSIRCFVLLVTALFTDHASSSPNIVFILTDDQDVVLGGMSPMVKTKKLIGDAGINFPNMFVSTPLCCPSRSSILTGRYIHNIGVLNNSVSGGCSSSDFQKGPEMKGFATYLKKQNYTTFFAGKYLNQYGFKKTGGPQHIPAGWDYWNGLVGNSVYYNYVLSANGKAERHGSDYSQDYLTHVIHQKATTFLNSEQSKQPFFMMLSTPACHAPFTPAPHYEANFTQCQAPRNGSFNVHGKDKHWLIRRAANPLSKTSVSYLDNAFRNRWRTLLSVDDMVEDVINTLRKNKLLDNTYVFFSSDNGFHLGQFSLPNDKRQMYEFDIRVPLMVRGPGIKAGQVRKEISVNIDLAPTFVDLASDGKSKPDMDGMSFKSLLHDADNSIMWRNTFLVQYSGEHHQENKGCPNTRGLANCHPDCVCEDAVNNTYECVRGMTTFNNFIYCSFDDDEGFNEFYDLSEDPDQLENRVRSISPSSHKQLKQALDLLSGCKGETCHVRSDFSLDDMYSVSLDELQAHISKENSPIQLGGDAELDHNSWLKHSLKVHGINSEQDVETCFKPQHKLYSQGDAGSDKLILNDEGNDCRPLSVDEKHIMEAKEKSEAIQELEKEVEVSKKKRSHPPPELADFSPPVQRKHVSSDDRSVDAGPPPLPDKKHSPSAPAVDEDSIHMTELGGSVIDEFAEQVRLKGKRSLYKKYAFIEMEPPSGSFTYSKAKCNLPKNRYTDVLCLDHSRVKLGHQNHDPTTDYINANFVDGYKHKNAFIATQGPVPKTFVDFWRMVWEQQVRMVVMTTRTIENRRMKCGQYWPEEEGSSHRHGEFILHNHNTERLTDYIVTSLLLRNTVTDEKREITHFLFVSWPDHGVPDTAAAFLDFLLHVRHQQAAIRQELGDTWGGHHSGPSIVIHCSAGIGRTGTFITMDITTKRLMDTGTIDIETTVRRIRSQRAFSIQTPDQYVFCHLALLEYAQRVGLLGSVDLTGFDDS